MSSASRTVRLLALTLPLLVLADCSKDSPTAPRIEATTFASSLGVNLASSTKTASGLYYRDIAVGSGPTAVAGKSVGVHYTGWLANGTQFDTNATATLPLFFTLGIGQVIPGFDEGITGMKVGGERQIIIPPALGYGASGQGTIPGNSVLVFTVDLVFVQ